MTIRDAFPDLIATDDDDSVISRYTDAHGNELEEIEGELDKILVTFQLRQIDLYGQRPDSSYSINYIDSDGNEQTLEVASFSLVEDIPDVDEVISVFDDDREYILNGDYELFFINGELEGIEWTPDNNNPLFDRIGQLFGEIGRRRGRNDREYRRFLNSLVPVLSGRGQVPTLKEAVAISLSMDPESIGVEENFQELEFEIILSDFWESHQGSAIESIVDRAKPSGVEHVSTRYQVPDEELLGATVVATTDGQQVVAESESSFDLVLLGIRITETFDESQSTDATTQDIQLDAPSIVQWDNFIWDDSSWDGKLPFNPTEALATIESDIDTFSTDQSNLSDGVVESVIISGKYGTTYGQSYGTSPLNEKPLSSDEETDDVTASSTRLRRWDASSWDSFSWDGSAFGEEIQSQVTLESDIDTFSTDQSNLFDGVVESVIISGKYGTTYGQSYGTSPLNEKPLSSDKETDEVNTSSTSPRRWDVSSWDSFSWDERIFGEEIQSQVTLESDIDTFSTDQSNSFDGVVESVIISGKYGTIYGQSYGTSPLNEKPLSSDKETDDVNTSLTRLRRWDASSWDSFSWDGSAFGEEVQSRVTVDVTVHE